jgi:hypothetical protein
MEKQRIKRRVKVTDDKIVSKEEWLKLFFGKFKYFGDGVKYQRKIRDGK